MAQVPPCSPGACPEQESNDATEQHERPLFVSDAAHVPAHGFEQSGVLGHELRQKRKEVVHAARWHRSTPVQGMRQASMAALAPSAWEASSALPSVMKRTC